MKPPVLKEKKRRCKFIDCKKEFVKNPHKSIDYCCSVDCYYQHSIWLKEQKEAKEQKAFKEALRENTKTLSQYEAEAKKSFQHYIRLRDEQDPCISCGTYTSDIWDGGHWFKAEIYSGLIFDERNCRKQCRKCNRYLGGNEINYRIGLVNKFGEEYVKELEIDSFSKRDYKFSKQELIAKKIQYDGKIKEWKKMK